MESSAMKWGLTVAVILLAWLLSVLLRSATRRLGRRRDFSRARIFQTAVVINTACVVLSLLTIGILWGLNP